MYSKSIGIPYYSAISWYFTGYCSSVGLYKLWASESWLLSLITILRVVSQFLGKAETDINVSYTEDPKD